MKTVDEFEQFYRSALMPDLKVIEAERKKALLLFMLMCGVIVAAVPAVAVVWRTFGYRPSVLVTILPLIVVAWAGAPKEARLKGSFALLILTGILLIHENMKVLYFILSPIFLGGYVRFFYRMATGKYAADFGERIAQKIAHFINEGLTYVKDSFVEEDEFTGSSLFEKTPDHMSGSDLVIGTVGETEISFSNCLAQYEYYSPERKITEHLTIFRGLFFVARLKGRSFPDIFIMPRGSMRLFAPRGYLLNKSIGSLAKAERFTDPYFRQRFEVYAEEPEGARILLYGEIVRLISAIGKVVGKPMYISIIGSKIHIAISYSKNILAPGAFLSLLDFASFRRYYELIALPVQIIEELDKKT